MLVQTHLNILYFCFYLVYTGLLPPLPSPLLFSGLFSTDCCPCSKQAGETAALAPNSRTLFLLIILLPSCMCIVPLLRVSMNQIDLYFFSLPFPVCVCVSIVLYTLFHYKSLCDHVSHLTLSSPPSLLSSHFSISHIRFIFQNCSTKFHAIYKGMGIIFLTLTRTGMSMRTAPYVRTIYNGT